LSSANFQSRTFHSLYDAALPRPAAKAGLALTRFFIILELIHAALHKNKGNQEKFRWLIVNSQLLILNYFTKDTEHQFRI
jgi:hypothetical protein